jgi:hypothetical protein
MVGEHGVPSKGGEMKFLTVVKPGPMPPPVDAVRAARDWINQRVSDGTFEVVYGFPTGGGMSIGESQTAEEMLERLLDYPLTPFVDYEVKPLIEVDAVFERMIPFAEKMTQQMGAAG